MISCKSRSCLVIIDTLCSLSFLSRALAQCYRYRYAALLSAQKARKLAHRCVYVARVRPVRRMASQIRNNTVRLQRHPENTFYPYVISTKFLDSGVAVVGRTRNIIYILTVANYLFTAHSEFIRISATHEIYRRAHNRMSSKH